MHCTEGWKEEQKFFVGGLSATEQLVIKVVIHVLGSLGQKVWEDLIPGGIRGGSKKFKLIKKKKKSGSTYEFAGFFFFLRK